MPPKKKREGKESFVDKLLSSGKLPELHIPGYHFCGPGTKLDKRLDSNLKPRKGSEPINALDNICYMHDIAYLDKSHEARKKADTEMLRGIEKLLKSKNASIKLKADASVAYAIIGAKKKLGLGKR